MTVKLTRETGPRDLPTHTLELERLARRRHDLREPYERARQRVEYETWAGQPGVAEALKPLIDHYDAIDFKKPGATTDPERLRELTLALLNRIRDGELEVTAMRNGSLKLNDPTAQRELDAAATAFHSAEREHNAYRDQHAEEIVNEHKRGVMLDFRQALDGDDPDALRRALGIEDVQPAAVGLASSAVNRPGRCMGPA